MALVLADRVQQTGTANTTVSFTLSGTVTGFQSFAVVGNTNTTYYSAFDASGNWEVGVGTYATGGTLTRTTVISSSNAGAAVTFSGSVNVFLTYPAEYAAWASNNPGTSGYVLTSNGTGVAPSWQAGGVGTITVSDFTATAAQTTFTVTYTVGLVEVYRNGIKLGQADYTATSGTAIVLTIGAIVGDLIEVVAFSALNLATAVSSISFGSTGLTPSTATAGVVTVAGTLAAGNGGTGLTSPGTSGNVLTSNGTGWTSSAPTGATITGTTTTGTYYVVGTTSTSGSLSTASISNTNVVSYNANTGALTAVSMSSSSDERLKTNWAGLDLDFVARLQDVKHGTFERISSGNREVGVTAQSLQKLIPEAVIEGEDGLLSVNYGGAALVAAIELAKVVQELRAEIKELKAKVNK